MQHTAGDKMRSNNRKEVIQTAFFPMFVENLINEYDEREKKKRVRTHTKDVAKTSEEKKREVKIKGKKENNNSNKIL